MFGRLNIANMVLDGVSRSVAVDPQRCSRIKHKSSRCVECHMFCPAEAINVGGPGTTINVDWDKCTGCGICVNVCPSQAYTLRNGGYKSLIDNCRRRISPDGSLTLACSLACAASGSAAASVECLGIINAVDILCLYLRGARKFIFKYGDCCDCDSKNGFKTLSRELDSIKELSGIFEDIAGVVTENDGFETRLIFPIQKPISRPKEEERPNPTLDRRGLFSFFTQNLKTGAVKSASMIIPDKPEQRTVISFEKRLPARRKIFLDSVMKLGNLTALEAATGRHFNMIYIDGGCVYCGMCAKFCGTGALTMNEERNSLTFNPSECVSCKLCERACYHGKLHYKDTLRLKDFFSNVTVAEKNPAG